MQMLCPIQLTFPHMLTPGVGSWYVSTRLKPLTRTLNFANWTALSLRWFEMTGIRCAILLECWRVRPQNEAEDQRRKPIPRWEDVRLGLDPEQSRPNIVSQAMTDSSGLRCDCACLIKELILNLCIDWLDRLENETQVYTEGAARFIYGHGRQNQDWKKLKWREPPKEHKNTEKLASGNYSYFKLSFFLSLFSFLVFLIFFWVLGCSFWCCISFQCHLCFWLALKLSYNGKRMMMGCPRTLSRYVKSSSGPV